MEIYQPRVPFRIRVGFVEPKQEPAAREISETLEKLDGRVPDELVRLPALAGPNEVIQLIADPISWVNFVNVMVAALGGAGGVALLRLERAANDRIRKLLGKPRPDDNAALLRLLAQIQERLAAGTTVTAALPIPTTMRNAGLQLKASDSGDLIRQFVQFGAQAPEIHDELVKGLISPEAFAQRQQNDDSSIKVTLDEDGRPTVHVGPPSAPKGPMGYK